MHADYGIGAVISHILRWVWALQKLSITTLTQLQNIKFTVVYNYKKSDDYTQNILCYNRMQK